MHTWCICICVCERQLTEGWPWQLLPIVVYSSGTRALTTSLSQTLVISQESTVAILRSKQLCSHLKMKNRGSEILRGFVSTRRVEKSGFELRSSAVHSSARVTFGRDRAPQLSEAIPIRKRHVLGQGPGPGSSRSEVLFQVSLMTPLF